MGVSDALIAFVADYERFEEMPYRGADSENRTVGYGHVIIEADGAKYDNGISQKDALILLESDMEIAIKAVNQMALDLDLQLTPQQFDALVSFTFNNGSNWTRSEQSVLRGYFKAGDFCKATERMLENNTSQGVPLLGLYRRRVDEVRIFNEGIYQRTYPDWPPGWP